MEDASPWAPVLMHRTGQFGRMSWVGLETNDAKVLSWYFPVERAVHSLSRTLRWFEQDVKTPPFVCAHVNVRVRASTEERRPVEQRDWAERRRSALHRAFLLHILQYVVHQLSHTTHGGTSPTCRPTRHIHASPPHPPPSHSLPLSITITLQHIHRTSPYNTPQPKMRVG